MKINDLGRVGAIQAYQKANKAQGAKKAEAKKDELQISKAGQELLQVQKSDILNPSSRAEKVERLKEQYESGTYQVNSKVVAEKMLQENSWLLK
ncbi:flagellar biosynthesis anti-sigma factor FlgM [Desulfuribacillus stibiiarsenatis]|uniref:Negative regulator of flagellin synthesis n=1 Tax=Desulfuribacillus stibiiarsenatis TaxID=1390249 RepID=A0A1E5L9T9_9FIRM|nr:flagellar biosynthesis anti-sigma factor FlgM [Desulfuribacillus stibiiarsenatis]OEH86723.1 flagellar biosynthesis anti-sigma factor FlgM [Desulfuribacillus stibiiarsenatis]